MRFEEGRIDQFVSTRKMISNEERAGLINSYKSGAVEALPEAFRQIKQSFLGSDDDPYDDEKPAFVKRSEEIAQYGYQGRGKYSDPSEVPARQKPTWLPLVVFFGILLGVIVAGTIGSIVVAIAIFLGGCSFLCFYAAYKQNAQTYSYYEGTTSTGGTKTGLWMGFLTGAPVIPLLLAGKIGTNAALVLMAIVLFGMVSIFLIFGFFSNLGLKGRKYKEEISADCVGYSRIVRCSRTQSGTNGIYHTHYYVSTSPIFEYTYQGREYKAIYDRMIDGSNADMDMGPARIFIDPDHPEDIYHKSTAVNVKGLLMGLLCVALTVFLVFYFVKNYTGENRQPEIKQPNMFALLVASDEEREAMMESMAESVMDQLDTEVPEEITDEMVDERIHSFVGYEDREWYYETVHVKNLYTYDNGAYSIEFDDPAFPQTSDVHDASYWHDDLLVFYVLDEEEGSDGRTVYYKIPIVFVNADEHTYVGSHGAAVIPE